jgi:hypothetical protein
VFALQCLDGVQIFAKIINIQAGILLVDPIFEFRAHVLEELNAGKKKETREISTMRGTTSIQTSMHLPVSFHEPSSSDGDSSILKRKAK